MLGVGWALMKHTMSIKENQHIYKMGTHKEIISRLKFIGKINKGDKINTKHIYICHDNFLTTISRTFFNTDNRWNSVKFIQDTIFRVFEILDTYQRSSPKNYEKNICKYIVRDLKKSKQGIKNIKQTYVTDLKFGTDMDTILILIDTKLQNILESSPELDIHSDDSSDDENTT